LLLILPLPAELQDDVVKLLLTSQPFFFQLLDDDGFVLSSLLSLPTVMTVEVFNIVVITVIAPGWPELSRKQKRTDLLFILPFRSFPEHFDRRRLMIFCKTSDGCGKQNVEIKAV
jgi:hypothetical protein